MYNEPTTGGSELAGRLILVTGGALRVGRSICEELGRAGARVVVHYHRSQAAAAELVRELGPGALAISADLRSADATAAMFQTLAERAGRIDMLVNNASLFYRTPFHSLTEEQWEEQLTVNLTAPQRCTRLAVRAGATAVVNLVDIAAWQPWNEYSAYSVAKAGLLHLTRILARELAPTVRVNAVAPGTVLFPDDYDATARARVLARVPLGRQGQPDDVARAVRFLLSEQYLTGVCLPIDGGQGLR
jgi:pteridine reductase